MPADEIRLAPRGHDDTDDTRIVPRGTPHHRAVGDTVARDTAGDDRLVDDLTDDQTRVVHRESDGATRVVTPRAGAAADDSQAEGDDDATRRSAARVDPDRADPDGADPDRTAPGLRRQTMPAAPPLVAALQGVHRLPDTPSGTTTRYPARIAVADSRPGRRTDQGGDSPRPVLPRTAAEIRQAAERRERVRSLRALIQILAVTAAVTTSAIGAIIVIASL